MKAMQNLFREKFKQALKYIEFKSSMLPVSL